MADPILYLTRRTNTCDKLVWAVIYKGQPICADTTEERAKHVYRANAKMLLAAAIVPCWNGDRGEWQTDMAYE